MANSQSGESIHNLLAREAQMPKKPEKYRMPDEQIVTVIMPVGLVRKMTKPWYLVPAKDAELVRNAMRHALWDEK